MNNQSKFTPTFCFITTEIYQHFYTTSNFVLISSNLGAPRIYVTVDTPLGPIRGRQLNTTTGNPVYTFKGIPYAEPPVGSLRFQPPVPVSSWTEEKDALQTPNRCIQMDGLGNIKGDEDCLYLNVFSPELPSDTSVPRPVLVLIHVGCFRTGYAQQRYLDYYIDHGIVVVSIQYRLGALGKKIDNTRRILTVKSNYLQVIIKYNITTTLTDF
ncbi:esterase SG1-like [Schistocerca piceifrons]|uniref:esterase SG1-like n=1 Tax=Schistocerca piceifrons TaxID=274613 RepID=UPI001F5E48DB|nr:esterase SG1-like [Schistocerca piceifrons]